MSSHDYAFETTWRVHGTCEQVSDILSRPEDLPRWWPSVYLRADVLEPGDVNGVGKRVEILARGFLPYKLRWGFVVTDARRPWGFSLQAHGDLVGTGVWTFRQHGADVIITYDWRVRAEKPVLRALSWVLKPLFAWNHRWAMAQGEASLQAELERRAAPAVARVREAMS